MIHVEYNIPETEFEQCAFNLSVQGYVNKESKGAEIQFCAEYLGNNCTNMAVVELEMPTGYRACESEYRENPLCLRDILLAKGKSLKLDKYEITDKSVMFYFEKLCNDKDTCIKFWAHREFEVVHSLPVSIRAYDYDEPSEECTQFYTLDNGHSELSLLCDDSNKQRSASLCMRRRSMSQT
ncbi:complement C3-like [Corticium candelabrum]|uniref:complement C3-like n=1 Tax=Corticium candelabrum TaxID=121492 RepID=UPI002E2757BF|nr:complement C3-like [Corticium candelabrum]